VNAIITYCLAVAAVRFGIELHAFAFLSNHFHLIATDCTGQLPLFMHDLDLLIARALNAHHGHFECLWAPGTYSLVQLPTADAVLEKMAYTLANPVAAGLVARSDLWPGVISSPTDLGAPARMVSRPPEFFRSAGPQALPAEVPLVLVTPPALAHLPLTTVRDLVAARLTEHEERARRQRGGRPYVGRRQILRQSVFARPRERDPHFGINPRVAARDRQARVEALLQLRSFLEAYRRAWKRLKAGFQDVVFPAGTWRLHRELGLPCEAPS
jgi:putative transposase